MRKFLVAAGVAVLAGAAILVPVGGASAHHNTISSTVECVDYEWVVTWSVENSENRVETITGTSDAALFAEGVQVPARGTITASEVFASPEDKQVKLKGQWDNGQTATNVGYVTSAQFVGDCTAPPADVETSGTVTFTDSVCLADAPVGNSATVTLGEGVTATYTVNGGAAQPVTQSVYMDIAAGDYVVTLAADAGFVLTGETVFSHTFTAPKTVTQCAPVVVAPPKPDDIVSQTVKNVINCKAKTRTITTTVTTTGSILDVLTNTWQRTVPVDVVTVEVVTINPDKLAACSAPPVDPPTDCDPTAQACGEVPPTNPEVPESLVTTGADVVPLWWAAGLSVLGGLVMLYRKFA